MLESLPLILALDVVDLIQYLIPFVFLLIWIISQISDAKKNSRPPLPRQQPAEPPESIEGRKPTRAQVPQTKRPVERDMTRDSLREQVDEFLRRADRAEVRDENRKNAAASRKNPPREIEILLDERKSPQRRDSLAEPLRPIERTSTSAQPLAPRPTRVERRVSRPMREEATAHRPVARGEADSRVLNARESRLGERIRREDAQFDLEQRSRFDHQLGNLSITRVLGTSEGATEPSPTPAAQIAEMLKSPEGVRQAIVLNEVLRRPVDRW